MQELSHTRACNTDSCLELRAASVQNVNFLLVAVGLRYGGNDDGVVKLAGEYTFNTVAIEHAKYKWLAFVIGVCWSRVDHNVVLICLVKSRLTACYR